MQASMTHRSNPAPRSAVEGEEQERNFHHPYTPYDIQKKFMSTVYRCLEEGKVGILESPTGTGKSLSLICGSLTWLRDYKRKVFEDGIEAAAEADDDEPAWMLAYTKEQKLRAAVQKRSELEARLAKVREREERTRKRFESGEPVYKKRKVGDIDDSMADDEAAFLPVEYDSDAEPTQSAKRVGGGELGLSSSTQALMEKLGMSLDKPSDRDDAEMPDEIKVFYCSRTHSQITQFVNELRRVKLPGAITITDGASAAAGDKADEPPIEELKHITLGSRKNLCINPKVSNLGNVTAINERCLELQQPGTAADLKCPHLPNKENEALVLDFRDHAMAKIRDIEDCGKLGKKLGVCPYYATRASVKPMEIVTLPYPMLLQKSARDALGVSLKNHVVIIDEAHNLMDAIAQIYSVSMSLAQLILARAQLLGYLQKFKNRLKGKNRVYATQLVRVIDSLSAYLQTRLASPSTADGQAQVGDLMSAKGADQINLYKLMHYLQESKLARKVERYAIFDNEQNSNDKGDKNGEKSRLTTTATRTTMPVLTHLQGFLMALTYPAAEGRFFFEKHSRDLGGQDEVILKYQLLDPTHHFREIVDEARAVILAGGTMSPMNDYTSHLLHYLPPERLETVSFGHVIPPSNLFAASISRGPNGGEFDFTFEKRNSPAMIRELGLAILSLARTVPDGLVVFFPSYAYLDTVVNHWQKATPDSNGINGQAGAQTLWTLLSSQKRIFLEPKSNSSKPPTTPHTAIFTTPTASTASITNTTKPDATADKVDKVLAAYTSHILHPTSSSTSTSTSGPSSENGALLLAVVGGSLSEGINFSDALGRCVAVVGLPFPNAQSAEWKAKLDFIAQRQRQQHHCPPSASASASTSASTAPTSAAAAAAASKDFYESSTMRSVNQSIGRAIRHKHDYASIVLLDRRYERESIRGKLPGWIREGFRTGLAWGSLVGGLGGFYGSRVRGRDV